MTKCRDYTLHSTYLNLLPLLNWISFNWIITTNFELNICSEYLIESFWVKIIYWMNFQKISPRVSYPVQLSRCPVFLAPDNILIQAASSTNALSRWQDPVGLYWHCWQVSQEWEPKNHSNVRDEANAVFFQDLWKTITMPTINIPTVEISQSGHSCPIMRYINDNISWCKLQIFHQDHIIS